MTGKFARSSVALLMSVASLGVAGCDREDTRDVEEGVNEVEQEVDELDDDGNDD